MGWIQEKIKEWRNQKKDSYSERDAYSQARQIENDYANKQLTSNERELRRYREEARQKRIKRELDYYRKRENDSVWRGRKGNPAYAKNVVAKHKKLFSSGNMFKKVPSVTKNKNVVNARNITKGGKKLFRR